MRAVVIAALVVAGAAEARPLSQAERQIVAAAASRNLKDPGSAQFRWPDARNLKDGSAPVYCAVVNARNSFGGYVGFAPFVASLIVRSGKVVAAVIVGPPAAPGSPGAQASEIMCAREGFDLSGMY